jgi:hypothetical protein
MHPAVAALEAAFPQPLDNCADGRRHLVGTAPRLTRNLAANPLNFTLASESRSNIWLRLFLLFLYRMARLRRPTNRMK